MTADVVYNQFYHSIVLATWLCTDLCHYWFIFWFCLNSCRHFLAWGKLICHFPFLVAKRASDIMSIRVCYTYDCMCMERNGQPFLLLWLIVRKTYLHSIYIYIPYTYTYTFKPHPHFACALSTINSGLTRWLCETQINTYRYYIFIMNTLFTAIVSIVGTAIL